MSRNLRLEDKGEEGIRFEVDGRKQAASHTWFRGEHCNFNPREENLLTAQSIRDHVLKGWTPPEPLIGADTKVVAFGSCFAANITRWLARRNFSVLTAKEGANSEAYVVRFGEGMVNTFVIRQQFEWAFENKVFDAELWHGYDATAFGYDEEVRRQTREMFDAADVFIVTLGLSEIWYDEVTGGVFWRAVPQDKYDPSRHKFRVSTVEENRENIMAIRRLIARHRPDAKVIFTLSPVPLVATFRPVSCMTANSVSKAVLRAALDEALREMEGEAESFYWPSYEIVLDVFSNRWKKDRRHVKDEVLDFIMTLFETEWCQGSEPERSLREMWVRARAATGSLPARIARLVESGKLKRLETFLGRRGVPQEDRDLVLGFVREVARRADQPLARKLEEWAEAQEAGEEGEGPARRGQGGGSGRRGRAAGAGEGRLRRKGKAGKAGGQAAAAADAGPRQRRQAARAGRAGSADGEPKGRPRGGPGRRGLNARRRRNPGAGPAEE